MKAKDRNKIDQTCLIAITRSMAEMFKTKHVGIDQLDTLSKKDAREMLKVYGSLHNNVMKIMVAADQYEGDIKLGSFGEMSLASCAESLGISLKGEEEEECCDDEQLDKDSESGTPSPILELISILDQAIAAKKKSGKGK